MTNTKATFQIRSDILAKFNAATKELGLRRDWYVQTVAEDVLPHLGKLPVNSKRGAEVLGFKFGRGLGSANEDLKKVSFNLSTSLVTRITRLSEEKGMMRDLLMQAILEAGTHALSIASVYIESPATSLDPGDFDWLVVNDAEIEKWNSAIRTLGGLAGLSAGQKED